MDFEIIELSEPYSVPPPPLPGAFVPNIYLVEIRADGEHLMYARDGETAEGAISQLATMDGTPQERLRKWGKQREHDAAINKYRERHARRRNKAKREEEG